MEQGRKEHLALYYWLDELLPDFVNVVRAYKKGDELEPPCVSIDSSDITNEPFELGNEDGLDNKFWAINVYALTVAQRDDLAEIIYRNLKKVPVYNYDEGFPPPNPTRIGTLIVDNKKNTPITVFEDLVEKLFWRRSITFTTKFEAI